MEEAKASNARYRLTKLPMAAFLRTRTLDETDGFAKAWSRWRMIHPRLHALGPNAGELLPVVQLAMKLGIAYQEIANLVITHPTMGEGLTGLFGSVSART